MVIGVLQFDLLIRGGESLKDKRRVVSSVKDRLHREHQVSVAEVALQDVLNVARLGLALVGSDGKHVGQVLDRIVAKLSALHDAELGDVAREIIEASGEERPGPYPDAEHPDGEINEEMLKRAAGAAGGES